MGVYETLILVLAVVATIAFNPSIACPGCSIERDASKFPVEKLRIALATANINEEVGKIVKVSSRIVAGVEFSVVFESVSGKTCTASWVEAPWKNKGPMAVKVSCRAKRSVEHCLGCPVKEDPKNFDMSKLYRTLATANVNEGVNKVVSVTTQVVAGIKYSVVYESKSGKTCTASWLDAPWESDTPLNIKVSCRAKRSVDVCTGCPVEQDPETVTVDKLQRTLATANVHEGVKKIISVATQVVAGLRYVVVYESASGKTCTVSWVEAPWKSEGPMDVEVSCRAKRSVESCPGCPMKQDPESLSMDKLRRALATANVNEGVKKIVSVTTQVVAGIKYSVVYESESGKTCTVSWVEAPWESEGPMDVQVSCRAKRSVDSCPGCPMKQDPKTFSMDKLQRTLASVSINEGVKKIISVTTQVVAGLRYVVVYESASGKTCTVSWVDAAWKREGPTDVQVSCRAKRSVSDGFEDVDTSEMNAIKAYSEEAINSQSNGKRKVVLKVLQAQKKTVNGVMYKVKFLAKSTACSIEEVPEKSCLDKEIAPREECSAVFVSSPYMVHGSLIVETMQIDCHNANSKSFMVLPFVDGHDEKDLEAAKMFAVTDVNKRVNNIYWLSPYKLLSTQEQMTEGGKLYTFDIQLRDTDCVKRPNMDLNKCHLVGQADDVRCQVSIFYSPFNGLKSVLSNVCNDVPKIHNPFEN